jgi:ubiquinone/menaquinone biosynthesis C-methylase UbiE
MTSEREYLDYYGRNDIIPVRQNTDDLALHMGRRRGLYRQLGLHPTAFRNIRVLEFGPGTGDNAIYVASCLPESYLLVDGNPASVRAINEKIDRGLLPADRVECQHSEIRAFRSDTQFDIVLCEGVLGGQQDTEEFLAHVATFVKPDGVLVITTMSGTGLLAECCRRVLKPLLEARFPDEDRLMEKLLDFFAPDLQSLPGMSRLHEDWVHDNILRPLPKRYTFTIPEAIATLEPEFDVLGASPNFIQDWRWYKSIPRHAPSWNDIARTEYSRWAPYFLDYRIHPDAPCDAAVSELEQECQIALLLEHEIWRGALGRIPEFVASLRRVQKMIASRMPSTVHSISAFVSGLECMLSGAAEPDFGSFHPWFGRGQQYASFVRKPLSQ